MLHAPVGDDALEGVGGIAVVLAEEGVVTAAIDGLPEHVLAESVMGVQPQVPVPVAETGGQAAVVGDQAAAVLVLHPAGGVGGGILDELRGIRVVRVVGGVVPFLQRLAALVIRLFGQEVGVRLVADLVGAHVPAGIADGDVGVRILIRSQGLDAGRVPGEVGADGPVRVAGIHRHHGQGGFHAAAGHLSDVLVQGIGEVGSGRDHDGVHQEVVGPAVIVLHAAAEAVLEEAEIQADVLGRRHLPLDGPVESGGPVGGIPGPVVQIGVELVGHIVAGLVRVAGADVLLAGLAIAGAQLEFVDESQTLDEWLLVQFPGDGGGREVTPAGLRRKAGGSIGAHRERKQVPVQEDVVQPAEPGA